MRMFVPNLCALFVLSFRQYILSLKLSLNEFSTVEGNVSAELLDGLFASLYSALRRPDDEANLLSSLSAFMILLRKTSMRAKFLRDQGLQMSVAIVRRARELTAITRLLPLITSKAQNIQIIYQTLYCCWLLTFDKQAASAAFKDSGVINLINQILKTHQKEKVIRIALATLKVCLALRCVAGWGSYALSLATGTFCL